MSENSFAEKGKGIHAVQRTEKNTIAVINVFIVTRGIPLDEWQELINRFGGDDLAADKLSQGSTGDIFAAVRFDITSGLKQGTTSQLES